ncbi:MAG: DNA cytosine methyltransferase [Armatimonadetes bacterium]|nr:DNA cytosine methyltransferase [Armatimonadota bacterium]
MTSPQFIAIDFFCGAGGTTRGLTDAGCWVIAGIDNDAANELTFVLNNPQPHDQGRRPKFICADVFPRTLGHPQGAQGEVRQQVGELLDKARHQWPDTPTLFSICAPCQPFTKLARKSLTEDRKKARYRDSSLLLESLKFIDSFRPDALFVENVAGICSERYGGIWQDFEGMVQELGYCIGSQLVCASAFGVPQRRRRMIMIGVKRRRLKEQFERLELPTKDARAARMTVRDAISHLPALVAGEAHPEIANHRTRSLVAVNLRRLAALAPGESNRKLSDTRFGDLTLQCHNDAQERLQDTCFSDVYTRMDPERPAPTITTKCHSISNGRFGHYDETQLRGISLREAACLQSFPDDYVFYPTEQLDPVARMIGNAAPPRLVAAFSRYVAELIAR